MNGMLLLEQALNGLQLGMLLFLLAAGLTLVFGIMDFVNLAHGSLYMMGAFFCATFTQWSDSFIIGALLTIPTVFLLGVLLDRLVLSKLYARDHLDQVLATFGLILFFNELVRIVWGPWGMNIPLPDYLNGNIELLPELLYPTYRMVIIASGLIVAVLLYLLISKTRLGMLVRAGANNREMIEALGVNVRLLFTLIFGLGAVLAGFAGVIAGPLLSVEIGMGTSIIILTFVVIVIGGIGSVKGAFIAAILVGFIDTLGRAFLPDVLKLMFSVDAALSAAPAISSILTYLLMAMVLIIKPQGLFPPKGAQ
ncbi:ABC transporter permease [Vibrio coralliilyticus]|uniref:ABC transporter permease n=1 Tax=Vibrio coralliilyticus TaxID=190893 RepID=A0A837GB31_9VIBR|nr:branched-chain amino acid ABC transporter permease [Vibrio coralliilyticus]KJY70957.1 ABC transporter permease [Vibrio coralliilyticus]QOU31062.1 branched-chain amino acid ABC transporter permease [Vibrio coralliilyticus]